MRLEIPNSIRQSCSIIISSKRLKPGLDYDILMGATIGIYYGSYCWCAFAIVYLKKGCSMKRSIAISIIVCLVVLSAKAQVITFGLGDAELEAGLNELNISAKVNMQVFQTEVSMVWGQPTASITFALSQGLTPGEVYLAAALAHLSSKPLNIVVELYQKNKQKGWGALAKDLGIKPGSKEFKQLKEQLAGSSKKLKSQKK